MYRIKIDGNDFDAEGTIESFVLSQKKNPDSYLFLIGSVPVPMDITPDNGTNVDAIRVASGG
jgi:hypothetical protein